MEIFNSRRPPEKLNLAASNFGGPKWPFALLEAPTPSRGMPIKLVSNFPLEFSSWNTETAYVPGLSPGNSHTAWPFVMGDLTMVTALSPIFGKPSADE